MLQAEADPGGDPIGVPLVGGGGGEADEGKPVM